MTSRRSWRTMVRSGGTTLSGSTTGRPHADHDRLARPDLYLRPLYRGSTSGCSPRGNRGGEAGPRGSETLRVRVRGRGRPRSGRTTLRLGRLPSARLSPTSSGRPSVLRPSPIRASFRIRQHRRPMEYHPRPRPIHARFGRGCRFWRPLFLLGNSLRLVRELPSLLPMLSRARFGGGISLWPRPFPPRERPGPVAHSARSTTPGAKGGRDGPARGRRRLRPRERRRSD
jgi:hypothetical protein